MEQREKREFLLHCLSTEGDRTDTSCLENLSTDDWDEVILESLKGGVTPLLYHFLKTNKRDVHIPAGAMLKLEDFYLASALENSQLYHELPKLLSMLKAEVIPFIVLKGAALAETVYKNVALRLMNDVDLLFRREDLHRTETVLLNLGYANPERFFRGRKWMEENNRHLPGYNKETGGRSVYVEVHWSIMSETSSLPVDMDEIWDRARPAKIANTETLILSPEDLLLHLCIHASLQHRFEINLRQIYDISRAIQHYQDEIDWEHFVSIANRYGVARLIYITFALTQKMLGTKIPEGVMSGLKPESFDPRLIALAEERIFSDVGSPPSFAQVISSKKLIGKLRMMLKYLFPDRSDIASRFAVKERSVFIYLFYPAYYLDFIKKSRPFLRNLIRRDKSTLSGFTLDKWILS